MNVKKREQLRRILGDIAKTHGSLIDFMEQALLLFNEEMAIDALTFWKSHQPPQEDRRRSGMLVFDYELLSIKYQGRSCFLGNTLSFRLIVRLARRPHTYVTYEDLLSEVWQRIRSDAAVRSVVKRLRGILRRQGMAELADAIDGSVPGHYSLKLGEVS